MKNPRLVIFIIYTLFKDKCIKKHLMTFTVKASCVFLDRIHSLNVPVLKNEMLLYLKKNYLYLIVNK